MFINPNNCGQEIKALNAEIIAAHDAHYANAPEGWDGLVDRRDPRYSSETSPDGNTIYHLYSTGEVTHQKGAWAYLDRSEFTLYPDFMGPNDLEDFYFKFSKKSKDMVTYAILTQQEAKMYREKMLDIYNRYKNEPRESLL